MSEINKFMEWCFWEEGIDITGDQAKKISSFIESNYIPKEEHEKAFENRQRMELINCNLSEALKITEENNKKLKESLSLCEKFITESQKLKQELFDQQMLNDVLSDHIALIEEAIQKLKDENEAWKNLVALMKETAIHDLKEENERLKRFLDKPHCDCTEDMKIGRTLFWCCNQCKLPVDLNKE
jgi:predicted phage tail protein